MKEKKLVGKIITVIFASLLIICFFTPLLSFSMNISTYSDITGGSDSKKTIAKYVTPMQVVSAQFASEETFEKAKLKFDAFVESVEDMDLSSEQEEDRIASSTEAAKYFTIFFSQEKELLPNLETGEFENMTGAMKLYTYFSFGLLALIVSLIVLLILRCVYPKKKGLTISGNILSILVFVVSALSIFITIPMKAEIRTVTLVGESSMAITANPNFLFTGILIAVSLLVMVLTLTTKGLKKNKKELKNNS